MKITMDQFIEVLKNKTGWIDANELAAFFNVTTRTIRNQVKKINGLFPQLILSSNKGYQLNLSTGIDFDEIKQLTESNINEERIKFVISRLLLSEKSLSIYDLSDDLAISDPHFERLLTMIKTYLLPYKLSLERKRNKIRLIGHESDKRKVINNLLSSDSNQFIYFSNPFDSSKFVISSLKDDLMYIFESFGFYINDYGFNTILLHVIIMIERITTGNYLEHTNVNLDTYPIKEREMMNEINKYIFNTYHISLNEDEIYWLKVVILNNSTNISEALLSKEELDKIIDPEFLALTGRILENLSVHYGIERFPSDFIFNFTIHIRNLILRAHNNSFTFNPLTYSFKGNYPLIYDMATYVAKEITTAKNIRINDDEISFIAFHIGAHLENSSLNKSKINCCFVYAEYHNFHVKSIEKIIHRLHCDLFISSTVSIKDIARIPEHVELIISCCSMPNSAIDTPIVETTMFVSDVDISNIREAVLAVKNRKKKEKIMLSLNRFIDKKLFKKEIFKENALEMIRFLANECHQLGLCDENYVTEVIEREQLSSTAFNNGVAIPHSLNMTANQSFLSVVINSKEMLWGEHYVNLILMIGTSVEDRDSFKVLFEELVIILFEPDHVRELIKCTSYEDFTEKLATMILNHDD